MNLILVGKSHNPSRVVPVNGLTIAALLLVLTAVIAGSVWLGVRLGSPEESQAAVKQPVVNQWQARLETQRSELERVNRVTRLQIDALTMRLGEIQGRLLRLDALGQRFVDTGLVGSEEFNFDEAPAMGGPEDSIGGDSFSAPQLSQMISQLDERLADREKQLRLLDTLMSRKKHEDDSFVAGRPITWGWLSSRYGYRSDPFNGKRTWHDGVDLAGREGSDIIAVAAGVVTFSGDRHGYGNLVEIDHGDGLVTRYAHAAELVAEVGDVVEKGQVIALMGSTGRSTGPHVHFEVRRDGKSQNPEEYIQRASR